MPRQFLISIGLLCLLLGFMAGCSMGGVTPRVQQGTGSVRVVISTPESQTTRSPGSKHGDMLHPNRQLNLSQVEVTLTNGTIVLSQNAALQNGAAEVIFTGVLVGPWTVTVSMKDEAGNIMYQGTSRVAVLKGQEARSNIVLKPATGTLELHADLRAIPNQQNVHKLRLYKDSTNLRSQVDIEREPGTDTIHATIPGILPKTYDMMIKLYDAEGVMIYESLWTSIDINPGKTTTVNWDFSSGGITVGTEYNEAPAPPSGLMATAGPDAMELSWQAPPTPENDLANYKVYRRDLPFGGYKVIATIGTDTAFQDARVEEGCIYSYVVTAVDAAGNESTRSNEVTVIYQGQSTGV